MSSSILHPDSPCIGTCSTTYGDEVCKGCGRTFLEVVNWIIYDEAEKAAVWARLEKLKAAHQQDSLNVGTPATPA